MPISARIDEEVQKKLEILSKAQGLSKSKIIAQSILEYFDNHFPVNSPYEIGKDLFGRYGSEKGDLSYNRKKYLKEKLSEKYSHH